MKNLTGNFKQIFITVFILVIAFQSCKEDNPSPSPVYEQGDIIQLSSMGNFTPVDIQQILDDGGTQIPFTLQYDVEALSVNYASVDRNGKKIWVSGALFIPQGIQNLPMLSLQHGTETNRKIVASVSPYNSSEGITGLVTASMGYVSLVPDYPGYGISQMMHPYLHDKSISHSVVDFIRAGKSYASKNGIGLNGQIFLTGYSEGGYVTLITQKAIEEEYAGELKLTAVAPLAGPYDLKGMCDSILLKASYLTPVYFAFVLTAYNEIYNWNRLDDFFRAPYASMMPGLFDGSKSWDEIVNLLPETLSEMMNPSFISDYNNGKEAAVYAALQENTLLDWIPQTPLNFFHGDADLVVPYQNALTATEVFKANGAENIQLTTIPDGTHGTSWSYAIIGAIQWFESF